jgi:hypothetical protein
MSGAVAGALPVRSWCGNGWKGVQMSLGGRTDVVLKFYDSWNRGEIDFDELVDEDIVNHQPDVEPNSVVTVFVRRSPGSWLPYRIRGGMYPTYLGAYFRGWTIPTPAKFAVEHVHIYRIGSRQTSRTFGLCGTT